MSNRVNDLRKLVQAVEVVARAISTDLQAGALDTDDQIAVGQLLDTIAKRANKAIDPLKSVLRKKALRQSTAPGPVYLNSTHGPSCMVVIPKASLKILKDADMDGLRALLGSRFDAFFETITSYKPRQEFENRTAACKDASERQAVLDAVKLDEGTPRVSFKG